MHSLARHNVLNFSMSAALTACFLSGSAFAQPVADKWQFSAGIGAVSHAEYPGSSESKISPVPILSASYGRFILGGLPGAGIPLGVGMNVIQSGPWRAGIGLGFNPGKARKESDSARLTGLGDIDGTAMGSIFGAYENENFAVRSSVVTDLGGNDQGTRVSLDLEGKLAVSDRLMLTAGPGLTWADRKYTQTFFGVTTAQSASSGLSAYNPSSGLNNLRFSLGANYKLTPQWSLGARLTAETLRGDAVDSPLTEKKSRTSMGIFANYRF